MIGTRVAHYEITAHLGSGGMGEVYEATDKRLGHKVAIKVLPDAFARTTPGVYRGQLSTTFLRRGFSALHAIKKN